MMNRGGFLKSIFGGIVAVVVGPTIIKALPATVPPVAVGRLILEALPATVPPVTPVTAKIFYMDYSYNPLYKS